MKKSKANKRTLTHPKKYTPATIAKLEAAFGYSFTIDQACMYAGINSDTFYDWIKRARGFEARMIKARERPNLKAKEVVIDSISNGNSTDAKWWLERKQANEFAPTNTGSVTVNNNFFGIINKDKDEFNIPTDV